MHTTIDHDVTKDQAMTVAEVADALGVSRRAVYDLCYEGLIEYERPSPGAIRIRRSVLLAYVESVRVPARG